jgi:hypothetical protein
MFKLTKYRLRKKGTNNFKPASIQKRLDQNLTLMTFLYTSHILCTLTDKKVVRLLILKYDIQTRIDI